MEKEDILNRWSEYITEFYHDDRDPPPTISNEDEGPHILEEEIQMALKKMKKGKAAGPDDIPSEMLTALGEFGIKEVIKLLNTIHATGEIPTNLKKSVYIALPKKLGTVECDQHRTISLMSHLTKVMLRVLMNRIRNKILPEISKTQCGFMADKSTRYAIFALRILMERAIEVQKDLYLCFIHYSILRHLAK
ncbi:RNA-directed DNA polymerase from mobile element jockey-like [Plakobranchus ocellatus]|uniref:RNA-directed DNA polymerase from mobile element jockey-like n=1 Tax=Plakobranchus ocellatus TaxID=259542 RepID=A0AAV3ZZV4_9GAST|nr:RNA-directed DNA polymerase from mobile element jockey-like [Plakobranchus ocellatus]